jgi:hypothetical protein
MEEWKLLNQIFLKLKVIIGRVKVKTVMFKLSNYKPLLSYMHLNIDNNTYNLDKNNSGLEN